MVKRETTKDKFFKKLWKGVKGIFKVFKLNNRPPSSRMDSEDEAPTDQFVNDVDGNGAESVKESSSQCRFRETSLTLILLHM